MGYARAALKADEETYSLRVYVTDALMALTENTAEPSGKYMTRRWAEFLAPQPTRSPVAIAREIMQGAGLKFERKS